METTATQMRRRLLFGRRHVEMADFGGELSGIEASEGASPVLGRKLDIAIAEPMAEDAENVPEILLGVEVMQAGRSDQGKQVAGGGAVVIGANKEPGLSPDGDVLKTTFGGIVVDVQTTIIKETLKSGFLANCSRPAGWDRLGRLGISGGLMHHRRGL